MASNHWRWNRLVFLALGALIFACSDGGGGCDSGCGGCGGGDGSGPAYVFEGNSNDHVVMQGGQVHVTQSGLDRIAANLEPLIGTLIGDGGLSFCLPPSDITVATLCGGSARCDDGTPGCQLTVELAGVRVIPQRTADPASDRIRVEADIVLDETLTTSGAVSCNIRVGDGSALPVSANIYLNVAGPEWERVSIDFPSDELELPVDDISITFSGGFLGACGVLNLAVPLVRGLVGGMITEPIEDAIGPALCRSCSTTADCPTGSTCNGESCIVSGTDECVPLPLGVEMELDIGSLLADFAPGLDASMGVLAYAANYADAMGPPGSGLAYEGIDLGLQIGFYAPANPCVPYAAPPATARVPKSPAINGDLTPSGDEFGVGIGVARSALNLAGWAAYRSGALCLSIGSDTISQISTGTFAILLPSLGDLVDGENRPMYLQLRPQKPPVFTLGAGTVNPDGTMADPLITVTLPELDIDFYVFAEDRYVRMLTLSGDVVVPLGLDVNDDNQIVILLGDLSAALSGLTPSNGELLSARDEASVATILPTLIGGLLPTLLGDLAPIDIPEIADGISIVIPPGGITSVGGGQMLAIFADLAFGTGGAKAAPLSPEIVAMHVERAPADAIAEMVRAAHAGEAEFDLDVLVPTVVLEMETIDASGLGAEFEYSYRINGGMWTQWRVGPELVIRDVAMGLSGDYEIDVQARVAGTPHTASPVLASTSVRVDYVPPTVRLGRSDAGVAVRIEDVHSPENLSARYRIDGGAWRRLEGELVDAGGLDAFEIEVEASDVFGNTSATKAAFAAFARPEPLATQGAPTSGDPARGGCASARGAGGWGVVLFGLLGMIATRRRAAVVVAGAALALAACGDDNKNTGDTGSRCEPACEDGQSCVEGVCVDEADCASDEDCGEGRSCQEGVCVDDTACSSDEDCTDGASCVDGECVPPTTCEGDEECADDQYCDESGICIDYECVSDADCGGCSDDDDPVCVDNECSCQPSCPQGCGEGTACCPSSDECVALTATCSDGACEPGFGMAPEGEPTFDPSTCEVSIECSCQELPPLRLGNSGVYLDLGVSVEAGVEAVAGYNSTYGDLMVGVIGDDGAIAWDFVAGVPSTGAITGSLNGPRGGIADAGDDVGEFPSIAVGADGALHVAFYSAGGPFRRTLGYAYGEPTDGAYEWTLLQIDATPGSGLYTDIEIDAEGFPVVGYVVPALRTDDGQYESQIRAVRASSAAPTGAEDWGAPAVVTRKVSALPCGASCVGRQVCRADLNLCQSPERASACAEDCGSGACFANEGADNSCAGVSPAPEGIRVLPESIGVFLDMEFLPEGRIGFAHYDRTAGNLLFAATDDTLAEVESVIVDGQVDSAEGPVDTGDAGWFPDLFVTGSGQVLISYAEASTGVLRVADIGAGATIPVDDGVRCYEFDGASGECARPLQVRVGYDSAIAEDADGLFLAYQDATWLEILESPLTEFGWDLPGTVASGGEPYSGAYGFYLGHGTGADGRFVVSYRINQRATPPTRDVAVISR